MPMLTCFQSEMQRGSSEQLSDDNRLSVSPASLLTVDLRCKPFHGMLP
jgi:hypothetical protein